MRKDDLKTRAGGLVERLGSALKRLDWRRIAAAGILVSLALMLYHTFRFMTIAGF